MISPQNNFFKRERMYFAHKLQDPDNREELIEEMKRIDYKERQAYKIDLIQPDSPKFKTYYKEEYEKLEKEKQEKELKEKTLKEERNKFYKDNLLIGKEKVKNALKLEDKIRYG